MIIAADLILDVPYGSYRKENIQITADDTDRLLTEAIPGRAFHEFERARTGEWTHVNVKFRFDDLEIEYVFDWEKTPVATVYISRVNTWEILSCSKEPIRFSDVADLAAETEIREEEAKILSEGLLKPEAAETEASEKR